MSYTRDVLELIDIIRSYENLTEFLLEKLYETREISSLNDLDQMEKEFLIRSLEKFNNNKMQIAKELNIPRSTLISKLQKFELV